MSLLLTVIKYLIDLQVVVFKHLINGLPSSRLAVYVDSSVVCYNVGYVLRIGRFQVTQ